MAQWVINHNLPVHMTIEVISILQAQDKTSAVFLHKGPQNTNKHKRWGTEHSLNKTVFFSIISSFIFPYLFSFSLLWFWDSQHCSIEERRAPTYGQFVHNMKIVLILNYLDLPVNQSKLRVRPRVGTHKHLNQLMMIDKIRRFFLDDHKVFCSSAHGASWFWWTSINMFSLWLMLWLLHHLLLCRLVDCTKRPILLRKNLRNYAFIDYYYQYSFWVFGENGREFGF